MRLSTTDPNACGNPSTTYLGIENPTTICKLLTHFDLYYEVVAESSINAAALGATRKLLADNAIKGNYTPKQGKACPYSIVAEFSLTKYSGTTETRYWDESATSYGTQSKRRTGSHTTTTSHSNRQSFSNLLTDCYVEVSCYMVDQNGDRVEIAANTGYAGDEAKISSAGQNNRNHSSSENSPRWGNSTHQVSDRSGHETRTDQAYLEKKSARKAVPSSVDAGLLTTLRETIDRVNYNLVNGIITVPGYCPKEKKTEVAAEPQYSGYTGDKKYLAYDE